MTIGRAELIDQTLRSVRLLHDSLLVVLPDRPAQLVVVHFGFVLSGSPKLGDSHRILDLEDAFLLVEPANDSHVGRAGVDLLQELLEELPQVDGRRSMLVSRLALRNPRLAARIALMLLLMLLLRLMLVMMLNLNLLLVLRWLAAVQVH